MTNNEEEFLEKINEINYPVIVKPSMLGSSIGIKKVNNVKELQKALNIASRVFLWRLSIIFSIQF